MKISARNVLTGTVKNRRSEGWLLLAHRRDVAEGILPVRADSGGLPFLPYRPCNQSTDARAISILVSQN